MSRSKTAKPPGPPSRPRCGSKSDMLAVGPRDEDGGTNLKLQAVKLLFADQISDRAAFDAAADQLLVFLANFRRGFFREAQTVKVDPLAAGGMGQQNFRVQTREFR